MIKNCRPWGLCAVLAGVALLSGCVAYPAGSYGYSEPYYGDPGPVVVQPNVYIDGTYGGGYYSRPRYPYPYYQGHPGYYPRADHPRPGWSGARPGVPVPPPPGLGPRTGGVAGTQVPIPPGRSAREINRMMTSPDSRNQTPP
ncbi:hypothetical protein H6CHR_02937 [Variovorax sp. PBL-H6]|uniref:hypothetical protein n=1 Tax=Variovorax sp. PBL-H6 TaxID=434009 RepID=UPI001316ECD4|nr:hypothetical protein [Variovorax sp. PBL-H6]VTU28151.1 hypothetical protein H6CHR_02937 [Variovorax sp. PBL-H6]